MADDALDELGQLNEADEVTAVPMPPTLDADDVAAWRSAILHAGHGAMVPDDLRPALSVAFRNDLPALVTLARTRPDRQGEVRVGAPGGAEPGSGYDVHERSRVGAGGSYRIDPTTGREVAVGAAPRRTGATSGVRVLDRGTGLERDT